MSASSVIVPHDRLRTVTTAILRGMGSSETESTIVADHLVESNLHGHDSHGVSMIPTYYRDYRDGALKLNAHARLVREDGPFGLFEGQAGHGQVIARETTEWAIAKARATGVAITSLRNVHHIGRVGTYGEMACAAGLISITFVSAKMGPAFVAPFRGREGRLSTNPICIAIPTHDKNAPFLLDFATSASARGKVRVAYTEGKQLPPGVVIDAEGNPSTDPGVVWPPTGGRGAMLPFGEHKGYGLAVACELLGAALSGSGTYQPENTFRGAVNAWLSIVFQPGRLGDLPYFEHEIEAFVDYVKGSPPRLPDLPVLVAGEPERMSRKQRLAQGIPLGASTWGEILEVAKTLSVHVPE